MNDDATSAPSQANLHTRRDFSAPFPTRSFPNAAPTKHKDTLNRRAVKIIQTRRQEREIRLDSDVRDKQFWTAQHHRCPVIHPCHSCSPTLTRLTRIPPLAPFRIASNHLLPFGVGRDKQTPVLFSNSNMLSTVLRAHSD